MVTTALPDASWPVTKRRISGRSGQSLGPLLEGRGGVSIEHGERREICEGDQHDDKVNRRLRNRRDWMNRSLRSSV